MKLTEQQKKEIYQIFLDQTTKNEIQDSDNIEKDLGIDSLDLLYIQCDIEKYLGLYIPDNFITECKTFKDVFTFLENIK